MASVETQLLQMCVDLVNVALDKNLKPNICVTIGNNFSFDFTTEYSSIISPTKKVSPSQKRRSELRKLKYEQSKIIGSQSENTSTKIEKDAADVETQVGADMIETGVNTDDGLSEKVLVDIGIQEGVYTLIG